MSTAGGEDRVQTGASRAVSGWLFAAGLLLAAFWPDPAIWLNERTLDLELSVDTHETFGMEPFQWDVPLWYLFGLVFISLVAGRGRNVRHVSNVLANDLRAFPREVLEHLRRHWKGMLGTILIAVAVCAGAVLVLDSQIIGWLSSVPESRTEPFTRPINRLAGGPVATLIGLFLLVSGLGWGSSRIARQGVAVAVVAFLAAIPMAVAKAVIGRLRPENWAGPFAFFAGGESFPSGHTLSAFVLASVIWFSRAQAFPVRLLALLLAVSVAISRVLTFRHWPSDVLASALLAILLASLVVPTLRAPRSGSAPGGDPTD